MKNFQITYSGVNNRLKLSLANNPQEITAGTAREAVEEYYKLFNSDNYWPDEDGNIFDADGDLICDINDDMIYFDGGYIAALEIQNQ
jgi:hypothetical protein